MQKDAGQLKEGRESRSPVARVLAWRILSTRFFHVLATFGLCFGITCFTWAFGRHNEILIFALGMVWTLTMTLFISEVSNRNSRLEGLVRERTLDLEIKNRELRDLTDELEKKNEELRALDEMKNAFLTSVSHEVRTPLTSIRSFSEILLNYEDENPETRREFLQIINVETERLTRLINDVLDLAKITSGRVDWVCGPVDVEEAVQNSARLLKYELQRCGLEMEVDVQEGLEPAYSEPDRLVQVVNNLITNAIKFTPSGGLIRVSASMVEHEDGNRFVEVSVEDTGRGIPQEALETIFDRFVQVGEPAKGRPQGTGLGLSITKEIIERFGGRVWAESRLGEGSRFRFVLPVYDPEVHEREIAAAVDRQERSAQEEMQHGGS